MKLILMVIMFVVNTKLCSAADLILWKDHADIVLMDRYYVQKIFTRKIARWPDGRNINVYTKPINSIEHRDFVKSVLGISPFYYQQLLETQTYTGAASAITEVPNDDQMIMKVEQDPSAIGYLNYEIFIGDKRVIIINNSDIQ